MTDNPKLKKLDSKRISMQKHEIQYCRKIARNILAPRKVKPVSVQRLAKAFLKMTFKNRRAKRGGMIVSLFLLIMFLMLSSQIVFANGYGEFSPRTHKLLDKFCAFQNRNVVHIACLGHWHFFGADKKKLKCNYLCDVEEHEI